MAEKPDDQGLLALKLQTLHEDVNEIKVALRALSEAITKLALVEERQSQASQMIERAFGAIERIEKRIGSLERASLAAGRTAIWVDRAIIAVVAAVFVYIARAVGLLK